MAINTISAVVTLALELPQLWADSTVLLLYLGPETIMPLTSILAAIVGFVLIFWRLLIKPFKKMTKSADQPQPEAGPAEPATAVDISSDQSG